MRRRTRSTLPSTTAMLSPKAMLAMAAEVYSPIPGRVRSSAERFGELAVALADEELGGFVEHAGSTIVAEAGPGGEDFGFGGEGEGEHSGEVSEECLVVVDDGGDAGLLEHDLGEPGAVGVGDVAPGEFAGMGFVPAHELAPEEDGVQFFFWVSALGWFASG